MATEKRLIDANALLETLCDCCSLQQQEMCKNDPVCATALVIAEYPEVDAVEVLHGQWNPRPYHKINSEGRVIKYCDFYYCSECGTERPIIPPYNYCPNCGAKMDGDGID